MGGQFAGLELITQVIGMAASLLIVRNLSKTEFAWYTLANNLQGTLGMFTIMGVGTGLLAMGGECLGDKVKMGGVVAAATSQRLLLLGIAGPIAIPIFASMLWKVGCPPWTIVGLVISALLLLFLAVADQSISSPLGLAGRYNIAQATGAVAALLRFVAVGLLLFSGAMSSIPLMLAGLFAGMAGVWLRLPYARDYIEFGLTATSIAKKRFRQLMLAQSPSVVTYMLEGQVAGFLVAWFGHTGSVADLGALSRFGLVLAVPAAFITKILTPRLASEKNPRRLRKIWFLGVGSSLLVGAALFVTTSIFAKPALSLLGSQYAGLKPELVLYAAYLGLSLLTVANGAIVSARAWMRHSWIRPIAVFGLQALTIRLMPPGTVTAAIMVMLAGSIGNFLTDTFLIVNGFRGKGAL